MPEEPLSSKSVEIAALAAPPVIDVRLGDPAWAKALPGVETLAYETVFETLRQAGPAGLEYPAEISLLLTDDRSMRALNLQYRGKDQSTNVLSFAAGDSPHSASADISVDGTRVLGDVALALGRVQSEADEGGVSLSHHVMHLIVHGVLHLLGHDHEDQMETQRMEGCEAGILLALGADNPYQPDRDDEGAGDHV